MPPHFSLSDGAVERTALTTQVYERLLERIVDRRFLPGQRLNVDQLARELRVSSTPVREGLARLSSQHLVQFEPFKGYRVLPAMDATRLGQLFDVRMLLETSAVGVGIELLDPAQVIVLGDSVAAMSALAERNSPDAVRTFNDMDRAFHHTIIELAHNEFLIDVYDTLSPHIHIGRFYYDCGVLAAQDLIAEHRAIVAAYERRDAVGAEACLRWHLQAARERLERVLTPRPNEE